MTKRDASQVSEREVVFLVGLAQFVNILDFMIVLPLGPDYARELGIATANLGIVGGSYTAAAAVAASAAATLSAWHCSRRCSMRASVLSGAAR